MNIYGVYCLSKFVAYFNTRYEAERFVMNCRLCMVYADCNAVHFEIKEEFV